MSRPSGVRQQGAQESLRLCPDSGPEVAWPCGCAPLEVVGNARQNLQLVFILLLCLVTFTNIDEGLWDHEILMLRKEL